MRVLNDFPCRRHRSQPQSRREMLAQCGSGFGAIALAALYTDAAFARRSKKELSSGTALHGAHHPAKAGSVIFLFRLGVMVEWW